jgi:hypothetical protein
MDNNSSASTSISNSEPIQSQIDDVWDMNYGRTADNNINNDQKPNIQVVNLLGLESDSDSKGNNKNKDIEWNKLCDIYEVTTSQKKALNKDSNKNNISNNTQTTNNKTAINTNNAKKSKKKKQNNKPELNKFKCNGCECNNGCGNYDEYDDYDDTYDSYYDY